jgi:AAA15 family ATPase/GTPase
MRFVKFEIENFKGIQNSILDFTKIPNAHVFTLVGLNESGKTTLLEAINSFSPDTGGVEILYRDVLRVIHPQDLVPKSKKANFSGDIVVRAIVSIDTDDRDKIQKFCHTELKCEIDIDKIPQEIRIERVHVFRNSDHVETESFWSIDVHLRKGKAKRFRYYDSDTPEWQELVKFMGNMIPKICYFPTFLFSFPDRIYLSNPPTNSPVNAYYVQIIQDILDSMGEDLEIQTHIVERVEKTVQPDTPWNFYGFWKGDEKKQIDHVMLGIAHQVTKIVFSRWSDVFGVAIQNVTIDVDWNVEVDSEDPNKRSVYLKFWIKDGPTKFEISERSLGFRWFFCFLLFTQFRAIRRDSAAVFLFDEPASNLHSRAQEQLLQSFSNIAVGNNMIIYSTHSHYMIEPRWLEGAFIVFNDAINYDKLPGSERAILAVNTNIHVKRYRDFVGQSGSTSTYFQPILDKLDYVPSKLELVGNAVLVEGKNDFYMLSYFKDIAFGRVHNINVIPSSGANDLGPLISLYLGWGRKFLVMLDDDTAGRRARDRYRQEWFLSNDAVITISDILPKMKNEALEKMLSPAALVTISTQVGKSHLSKKDIARFFQERYAQSCAVTFDNDTLTNFKNLLDECSKRLG